MIYKNSDQLTPFNCDLHIHSLLSPCAENKMTPGEILKKIITLGIEIFSITDHNACFNSAAFEEKSIENNILFIPGIELQTSEEIHLLGYFPDVKTLNNFCLNIVKPSLNSSMKNDPSQFGQQIKINSSSEVIGEDEAMLIMPLNKSIDNLVQNIHDFNGIAVPAHIDRGFSLISQLGYIPSQLKIDAVEIWNLKKLESIRSEFLHANHLNVISSSDSHYLDMMKPPKMKLWLKNMDVQSCLDCIRGIGNGRVSLSDKLTRGSHKNKNLNLDSKKTNLKNDWKNIYDS